MQIFSIGLFIGVIFVIIILSNAIRVLREYERGVIFRVDGVFDDVLGRIHRRAADHFGHFGIGRRDERRGDRPGEGDAHGERRSGKGNPGVHVRLRCWFGPIVAFPPLIGADWLRTVPGEVSGLDQKNAPSRNHLRGVKRRAASGRIGIRRRDCRIGGLNALEVRN